MTKQWVYLGRNAKAEYVKVLGHEPELAEMKMLKEHVYGPIVGKMLGVEEKDSEVEEEVAF